MLQKAERGLEIRPEDVKSVSKSDFDALCHFKSFESRTFCHP